MGVDALDAGILIGAAVLLAAVVAVRVSVGTGTPSLLLYLALGVALGEDGLGIEFRDYELTVVLGYCALVLILAEGGLTTRWSTVRGAMAPAAVLATAGSAVSVLVVAAATHWLLGTPWTLALLLGAVVASTDAAAVFSVLRRLPLPPRLTGLLEAESGVNDAPVVIAVVALSEALAGEPQHPWWALGLLALVELAGGAALGGLVGWLGVRLVRWMALPSSGLYPVAVLALCALAYGAGTQLHLSGFIAVYLAALVLGNADLPHRQAVRGFAEGVGWLAQIGLFVLLGLLLAPSQLPEVLVPALLVGGVLLLVARPLSVLVSVSWFRIPLREQALLSWGGLRGAVPIVLATVPAAVGVPGSGNLVELVFVLVVVFTLVQAPTLPWVARRLGLAGTESRELAVEASPLGAIGADVLQVRIGPGSRLHGLEVFELRLPQGADVALVVRDGRARVPEPRTVLRHGDDLLIVAVEEVRAAAEARLHDLDRGGRLATWSAPGDRAPGRAAPGQPPQRQR
ncbi:potassium/proton antiporter [Quadrisphaera sp. DSM 44207]|uniref:potassium/proton antiporter n=1 Tax=Quadrisphaera sp. DSM 44207 TaxID=1881057 RepID=UPI00088F9CE2|nr:potassium/proton antiporter [Quadrisphaera sp. DSM 44207]SDQ66194.1 potassium/proton antiporter, CPA1 family [Quadrisphaera sp. DSM 44207]